MEMDKCEILKTIWKNKSYNLINEDILYENTFMQQTSGHENLWKVQIGITQNYLIFLKCELDLRMKTLELGNNSRLVIHMCPFNSLQIKKLPRRKLETSFPNGCTCFYKLLIDFGCGSSWSRWRKIEAISTLKTCNYPSRWTLIRFTELDSHVQHYLRTQKFLRSPKLLTVILSFEESVIEDGRSIDFKPSYDLSNFYKKSEHLFKTESLSKISESGHRLSCHSFESEVNLAKKFSTEIGSDYVKEKLAPSETALEIEQAGDDTTEKGLEPKPVVERSKGTRKTRKVRRFGEGIPDGCTFDLSLSYSDSVSEEEAVDSKRVLRAESMRMSPFDYLIDEKVALKDIKCSQDKLLLIKDDEKIKKTPKQLSKLADYCPHISSLSQIARKIKRSKSADSLLSIESVPYHLAYIKANLSLPNLDEIAFHRRTHRLSYAADFGSSYRDDEANDLSFWTPGSENSCGRIYNPTPMSRKLEVSKLKSKFIRSCVQFSSSQRIRGSQSVDENSTNSSHSSSELIGDEHTCKKGEGAFGFTKKLLDEMENEYPTRHSLWIESPDMKKQNSSPQNSAVSPDIEEVSDEPSENSDRRITEVNHEMVSRGLKAIQQELFCRIESSELARYILKPHSVTEVNSPYLCGYLFFFERLRNLVISELLAERASSKMADVFRYFAQVAYLCMQMHDNQSACAILSGLCSLAILRHQDLWETLYENTPDEMSILSQILQIRWNEKKHGKSEIPFFRNIIEELLAELPKEFTPRIYKRRRYSEFIQEWFQWKRERKKPDTFMDRLTKALSPVLAKCNGKKKRTQPGRDYASDDFFTTRYRDFEKIINAIEDGRKFYPFRTDDLPLDKDVRYFLLHKKLGKCSHNANQIKM